MRLAIEIFRATTGAYWSNCLALLMLFALSTSLRAGIVKDTEQTSASKSPRSLAVLIGIGEFQNFNIRPLPDTVIQGDLRLVAKTLRAHAGCDRVVTITTDKKGRGTYSDILTRLRSALVEAERDEYETVWVYFSGHSEKLSDGRVFLIPADCDQERVALTAISADHVSRLLGDCKCKHRYLVIDGSHAGAVSVPRGVCLIGSSGPEQLAAECKNGKSSLFTRWLCRGLNGRADLDADGSITLKELNAFLTVHVSEQSRADFTWTQTPVFSQSNATVLNRPIVGGTRK